MWVSVYIYIYIYREREREREKEREREIVDWKNPTRCHHAPTLICISIFSLLFPFLSLLLSAHSSFLSISSYSLTLRNNQRSDEVFAEIKTKYKRNPLSVFRLTTFPLILLHKHTHTHILGWQERSSGFFDFDYKWCIFQ